MSWKHLIIPCDCTETRVKPDLCSLSAEEARSLWISGVHFQRSLRGAGSSLTLAALTSFDGLPVLMTHGNMISLCISFVKSYLDFQSKCRQVSQIHFVLSFLTCIWVDTLCTARGQFLQTLSVHTRPHSSRQLLRQTDTDTLFSEILLSQTEKLHEVTVSSLYLSILPHTASTCSFIYISSACYTLQRRNNLHKKPLAL